MDYLSEKELISRLTVPAGKIRLVMDTDAKNEIDDQFAISWALRSEDRFDVEAVYAAPFSHDCFKQFFSNKKSERSSSITYTNDPGTGMEGSYHEICKVYDLLGISHEGKVFRGSDSYITDRHSAVPSDAARDLVNRAMNGDSILYVAAFGAITNIASAIAMEPEIIKKIVVIWLGGQPLYFDHALEFNLMQDIEASRIIFDSGVPLVYIPCMNVASLLAASKEEIQSNLLHTSTIGNYLAELALKCFGNVEHAAYAISMYRNSYLRNREDQDDAYLSQFQSRHIAWSRVIWDIATIAFLKNPNWTPSTLVPSPILEDDLTWGVSSAKRHLIRVVNYCHRDFILGDMFYCLSKTD